MKKVMHVVNDADMGGAQTLIEELCRRHEGRVELSVLVLMGKGALSQRLEAVAAVHYLHIDRASNSILRMIADVRTLIAAERPDIVHSHLLQADLIIALATIGTSAQVVSTTHTTGMTSADPLRSRLISRVIGPLTAIRMARTVACGDAAERYMRSRLYPRRKTVIIRNGVAMPQEAPTSPRRRGSLLSVARWHPMKDHVTLFRAIALLHERGLTDVRLSCAGSGMTPGNPAVIAALDAAGIRHAVSLEGPVSDVRRLMREHEAVVFSSAYGEALPMSGLEALSESTPVVSTLVGDCELLLVDPSLGAVPGSPESLAQAMTTLIHRGDDTRACHGARAREIISADYDAADRAEEYLDVYARALEGRLSQVRS